MTYFNLLAAGLAAMLACAAPDLAVAQSKLPELPGWNAPLGRDHPLTGRIFSGDGDRPVDSARLVREANDSAFVLLGEKHDNPDHHALQAWVIRAMSEARRRPAVAMEMLTTDQAPAVARYLAGPDASAAGFGKAVGWQGWPDWSIYQPIAEAALAAGLPIVAGDLPLTARRAIGRGDTAALPERLDLATVYAPQQAASLAQELRDSHCGQLPDAAVPRMSDVQRARDAHMAVSMIDAAAQPGLDGAVLIAGAGHVRRDRAVPWHLARMAPGRKVLAIAFREVDASNTDPAGYVAPGLFDYVWFTPRLDDEDPCARFKDQLQRLRRP